MEYEIFRDRCVICDYAEGYGSDYADRPVEKLVRVYHREKFKKVLCDTCNDEAFNNLKSLGETTNEGELPILDSDFDGEDLDPREI